MKCKRHSDGRTLDHIAVQTMRMQAVKAVREGQPVQSVADAYGVNIRSVFRWLADFASGGQQALQAKPIPGRPKKLSGEQMLWLASAVRHHTPQQYQFKFALWTLQLIGEVIHRRFGIRLSRSALGRAMKALGFTPQRPLYRAKQRDAVLVERWQQEEFPAIVAEARRAGATILFADEAGIRSDYHAGTTWSPRGRTPVVATTGQRFSLNMLSAVSATGQFRFMIHEGTVTAQVFLKFLTRLMQGASRPVYLVVDGHPIHRARIVKEYVATQEGKLKLFFLPPYSPHLNPDEQVWGNVKARVAKRTVENRADLKAKVISALRRLQKLTATLRGFFRHPDCRYIAEAQLAI
jgi:transposase